MLLYCFEAPCIGGVSVKYKLGMEAFIELEEGEHIVKFVAKTLKNPPATLREVEMRVPEYTTHRLESTVRKQE